MSLNVPKQIAKYRNLIFVVISVTYILSYFQRAAPVVVGPVLQDEFQLIPSQLGLIGSMYFWAYALTGLPAGLLADSWGARKTIAIFVLVAGVGGILFSITNSLNILFTSRFIIGLGFSVVYVAALRIFSDWYPPYLLATYSGILLALGNIGALLSTTPLAVAIDCFGWRHTFMFVGIITIVLSAIALLVIINTPQEYTSKKVIKQNSLTFKSLTTAIKIIFTNYKIYILGILLFVFYGTFMGVGALWAGPYLQFVHGLSKQVASYIIMLFPLGMVIGCPVAGFLSDKVFHSRKIVLLYGGIIHLLSYIPLIFFFDYLSNWSLAVIFFLYGFFGSSFVVSFACVKEIFPANYAATAVGALNFFLSMGSAFFQYFIGSYITAFSHHIMDIRWLYASSLLIPALSLAIGLLIFTRFEEIKISD